MADEQVTIPVDSDKSAEARNALRAALIAARDNVSGLLELTDAVLDAYGTTPENVVLTARMAASWLVQHGLDVVAAVREADHA